MTTCFSDESDAVATPKNESNETALFALIALASEEIVNISQHPVYFGKKHPLGFPLSRLTELLYIVQQPDVLYNKTKKKQGKFKLQEKNIMYHHRLSKTKFTEHTVYCSQNICQLLSHEHTSDSYINIRVDTAKLQ